MLKIGNSPYAPQFKVVSSPNDWSEAVVQDTQRQISKNLSETQLLQEKYWTQLQEKILQCEVQIQFPKPGPWHYLNFNIGRPNFGIRAWHRKRDKDIGVLLYISGQDAKPYFHLLRDQKNEIEQKFGETLTWSERPDSGESFILLTKENTDPTNETNWNNQHDWIISKLVLFNEVFRKRIKVLNVDDWQLEDIEDE